MRHARSDYDSVQDMSGRIPDDEPVFLLRATDSLAPSVIFHWCRLAEANKCDPEMIEAARAQALRMAGYKPGETNLPDMPKGAGQ